MAANGYVITGSSLDEVTRPLERWRPPGRAWLALALALIFLGMISAPEAVQAAATELCTYGTPDGTSCGEALVLLGYP